MSGKLALRVVPAKTIKRSSSSSLASSEQSESPVSTPRKALAASSPGLCVVSSGFSPTTSPKKKLKGTQNEVPSPTKILANPNWIIEESMSEYSEEYEEEDEDLRREKTRMSLMKHGKGLQTKETPLTSLVNELMGNASDEKLLQAMESLEPWKKNMANLADTLEREQRSCWYRNVGTVLATERAYGANEIKRKDRMILETRRMKQKL